MKMIYKKGLCASPLPEKIIDLEKEKILSWQILKLKNWNSPNLVIVFQKFTFEQPIGMILNYKNVVNYLKKLKLK